jgi:hypothetical protein
VELSGICHVVSAIKTADTTTKGGISPAAQRRLSQRFTPIKTA